MKLIDKILIESKIVLSETVINLLPNDIKKKEQYADIVWDLLQNSYAKIGGIKGSGFNSKEDMIKNMPMWKLIKKDGRIVCVIMYKDVNGRKRVASGTDGSIEGKHAFKQLSKDEIKTQRSYGEISGAPLAIAYKQHPDLKNYAIPFDKVVELLKGKGVERPDANDEYLQTYPELKDFFYKRKIGDEWKTKIMFGKANNKLV